MDIKLMKELLSEYTQKHDSIMAQYGEKDGFIIDGRLWWKYYKDLITKSIESIHQGTFTIEDATAFYKVFGFGPKLYNISFIESGLDNIKNLFLYLADDSVSPDQKIKDVVESTDSEYAVRGVGINKRKIGVRLKT